MLIPDYTPGELAKTIMEKPELEARETVSKLLAELGACYEAGISDSTHYADLLRDMAVELHGPVEIVHHKAKAAGVKIKLPKLTKKNRIRWN